MDHQSEEEMANKQKAQAKQDVKHQAEEHRSPERTQARVGRENTSEDDNDDDEMETKQTDIDETRAVESLPAYLGDLGLNGCTAEVGRKTSSTSSSSRTGAARVYPQNGIGCNGDSFGVLGVTHQTPSSTRHAENRIMRDKRQIYETRGVQAQRQQQQNPPLVEAAQNRDNGVSCAAGCSRLEDSAVGAAWGDCSQRVEQDAVVAPSDRARGPRWLSPQEGGGKSAPCDGSGDQQGSQEEGHPDGVHPRTAACEPHGQRDDRDPQVEGPGCSIPHVCGTPTGLGGVWTTRKQEVPGSVCPGARILPMGPDNGSGGTHMSEASAPCELVGATRPSRSQKDGSGLSEGLQERKQEQGIQRRSPAELWKGEACGAVDGDGGDVSQGGSELEGGERSPSEDHQFRGRSFFERMGNHDQPAVTVLRDEGHMSQAWDLETREKPLDVHLARHLDFQAERLVPNAFQSLVTHGRAVLFEVACGPDSLLTAKMRQLTGSESSAERLSFWNGYDMTTSLGVRAVINKIEREKPCHVWLSLECGPFSKMQNVNQRTEKQREELKQKRNNCIRQYIGGLLVYIHCCQNGTPVTWEWSETNDAWRLPMVQRVFAKYPPKFCVVKGCRVNLRDLKTRIPLQKGWKLATTHALMSQNMSLPCTCQAPHAPCQGRMTRESAYYTDDFARRVCKTILEDISNQDLRAEVTGHTGVPKEFLGYAKGCSCEAVTHPRSDLRCNQCEMGHEVGEPLSMVGINKGNNAVGPLTLEERDKALRDIATIHRNTGHGPLEHLVRALEARKTDPRIIQLAREFECDVCRECSRRVPRPQVSLEPLPPKWKVLQADNAHWIHPHSGERVQFTILIDEGCRFRMGKIMSVGKGSGVKAKDLVTFFQEQWKPVFGKPDKVRLDPAGSWRSNEVREYFESIHVEMDVIPAEAHWNTSHVERAIQATKHVMYRMAAEDPQISAAEALSEAIRVENEREVVRGYSPAQHALGRAPDAAGRFFESEHLEVPPVLCENGNGEYRRNIERMRHAEQAFSEWVANDRINRAKNTRPYKVKSFSPGELVCLASPDTGTRKRG